MYSSKRLKDTTRQILRAAACLLTLATLGHTNPAAGQCELQKLIDSVDPQARRFGDAIDIDGDVAVIGAPVDPINGVGSGAAYIYRLDPVTSTWLFEQKLTGASGNNFGTDVAISGDVIMVGAPFANIDGGITSGLVEVFRFNGTGWLAEQFISPLVDDDGSRFGLSLAISGDVVAIGAPGYGPVFGSEPGAVFVFRYNGSSWVEETSFVGSTATFSDEFGQAVDISGDAIVVGTTNIDAFSGAAWVFRYDGVAWSEEQRIVPAEVTALSLFAGSVAIDNGTVLLGSSSDHDMGVVSGAVYVYEFNGATWDRADKLHASFPTSGAQFGQSVALDGSLALIGSRGDDTNGINAGDVHVFSHDGFGWSPTVQFLASDGAAGDLFGRAIGLGGTAAMVGAPFDDDPVIGAGSVYVIGGLGDCNGNGEIDCVDILNGTSADLNGNNVPDICEALAHNETIDVVYDTISLALPASGPGHSIVATELAFDAEPDIAFPAHAVTLASGGNITQPNFGLYRLTDGATLETGFLDTTTIGGELRIEAGATADVRTGTLIIDPTGQFVARSGSYAALTAQFMSLGGNNRVEPLATLSLSGPANVESNGNLLLLSSTLFAENLTIGGTMTMSTSTTYATSLSVGMNGRLNTSGDIFAAVNNDNALFCLGNTLVVGDYFNNGTTTIQVGTLTIVGNLTNMGTILGDLAPPPAAAFDGGGSGDEGDAKSAAAPGDGMSISGHYIAGPATSLNMPDAIWTFSVGGNFDLAIDNNLNYDMSLATLHLNGLSGTTQNLEIMSLDIGDDPAGFDRTLAGHFPIGTLHIGPNATTVNMVDNHDNDQMGQILCEAIYVKDLIIDAAATLNTNGCTVYYSTLQLNGTVDDPLNLVPVADVPICLSDSDNDGTVGILDFLAVLANWGPCGAACPSDSDGDGNVGILDFLAVLAGWGACP